MRTYSNANSVAYKMYDKKGNLIFSTEKAACYGELRRSGHTAAKVEFNNFRANETNDYTDFYLKYIAEMLGLPYELSEKSFILPTSKNRTANLILGTLVRMLFEGSDINKANKFFEDLKTGTSKYRNKLKRFCDFYSRMPSAYIDTGHYITTPKKIVILDTVDFEKLTNESSTEGSLVNQFFEGTYPYKQKEKVKK